MLQMAAFRILAGFYDSDERSFVDLCASAGYPTDLGGYYIRQLIQGGYIQKVGRGRYAILPKGKQQVALKYHKPFFAPKPRFIVLLVVQQNDRYIVMRRKVQPFIGAAEWIAGEVQMGEQLTGAAERIAMARLGCSGAVRPVGLFRRIDHFDDFTFDDKIFAVHAVTLPASADITHANTWGEMLLLTELEVLAIERPSKSLLDIFRYTRLDNPPPFEEHSYTLQAADLSL